MTDSYLTPRQRVVTSMVGSVPGLITIYFLMSSWAPAWAVHAWTLVYAAVSVCGWILVLRGSERVEQWWSSAIGALFGLLPVTATIWEPGSKSYWIAACIVLAAIANEVTSLPYIRIGEWRVGVSIASVLTAITGFIEAGPVAIAVIPVFGAIIMNGQRMRAVKEDLEAARSTAEAETEHARTLAVRDELTGVYNRRGIAHEINRPRPSPHTVLMIDVDRLKSVNDGHGYAAGDQVIQEVATVLSKRLGEQWTLGRQGGDEFLAIADGNQTIADDTCAPVLCHISLYGAPAELLIGLSGGIVVSEGDESPDRLVSKAGFAMRAAKRNGGGLLRFDDELATRFDQMLEISVHSTGEVSASSLVADFQIIVNDRGHIVGCEALARWRRGDGTLVPPATFLPLLVENGQMPVLNRAMLGKGIAFAARFNDLDAPPFVSVNIASSSLGAAGLADLISSLLAEHHVAPERLMIEITETEGFGHGTSWEAAARELKTLGVKLAIDDFGSGYSNIERLGQLPISHLKFDRSLTTTVSGPVGGIVRGVVDFANDAGIGIIAEGIETPEELLAMRAIGFQTFQGYFFGRPAHPRIVAEQIFSNHQLPAAADTSRVQPPHKATHVANVRDGLYAVIGRGSDPASPRQD